MTNEQFLRIFEDIISRCKSMLAEKKDRYTADKDRLSQFKEIAVLSHCSSIEALRGLMVKHTTGLYDLIEHYKRGKYPPKELWQELITDHINYHVLLYALLHEENFGRHTMSSGNGTVDEVKPNEKLKL